MQLFALLVHLQDFWIFGAEPWWGRSGWGPENHANVAAVKDVDRALKPVKIELALGRLHQRPCEFRDAHVGEAGLGDPAGIFLPEGLRRLIGIIVDTEQSGKGR